jgi:proteasome lid subunit RPN8/RPN11
VRLKKSQLARFRRIARDSPNEQIAYLIGKKCRGKHIEVQQFVYPQMDVSTPQAIKISPESVSSIHEAATRAGLAVVGTIHSHPNYLPIMSPCDLADHTSHEHYVSGIVEVTNRKTRVAFWTQHSPLVCVLEYI